MLYLVATPIGNLEDVTYRAVRVLQTCDYILCEDSRKSSILLNHYQIKKELLPFHKFCEKKREKKILDDLEMGKNIALISDAGTPLLSDPGLSLVQECIARKISLTAVPGPSSLLNALLLSGFATAPLLFLGFLQKKRSEKEREIQKMLFFPGTSVCFETKERLLETVEIIEELDPARNIAIAREMTKKFEECLRGKPVEILQLLQAHPPQGECVLLLEQNTVPSSSLKPEELILLLQEMLGVNEKEAVAMAAKIRKCPKRTYYNAFMKKE